MVLLRKVIGDALRARRLAQHRTLRDVSTAANVSLGYLSEIERGHKEASSELLASICEALGARVSEMLSDVSATFALEEQMEEAFAAAVARGQDGAAEMEKAGALAAPASGAAVPSRGADAPSRGADASSRGADGSSRGADGSDSSPRGDTAEPARASLAAAPTPGEVSAQPPAAVVDQVGQAGDEVTDGDVTVVVRSDGPLRTRLTTKRTAPGQRQNESLTVG